VDVVAAARAVAVFCGSRPGHDPALREAAVTLGAGLAAQGIRLIYGGGRVGLMGAVADAVLDGGGEVTGVIPDFLTRLEVAHPGVDDLRVTDSMHTRKRMMFDMADAFVTLPGGFGTLDETIEVLTWRQLGLHAKPIILCNAGGWVGALLSTLRGTVTQGFASADCLDMLEVLDSPRDVLARLRALPARAEAESARL
jgi:uncharacterized protein (TIGR00730 family)